MRTGCSGWIFIIRSGSSRLALLAFWAEVRSALGHQDAADRRGAGLTGLAFLAVHAVAELEAAGAAVGIDVVRDGGAAGPDGFEQHFLDGAVQPGGAKAVEAGGE